MVRNQNQIQEIRTKKVPKKVPVCVYWNPDKFGYEIYMAEYIRNIGWIETMYLGFARDLKELREIMKRFGYIPVCGLSVDDLDATPHRRVNDCDPVTRLTTVC